MTDKHDTGLIRDELIGLKVVVEDSNNKSVVGLKGKVIDETKSTLTIETDDNKLKKLIKDQVKLRFVEAGVVVDGKKIAKRPEERLKLKLND